MMRKCKNCINGFVQGGRKKRIKRNVLKLDILKDQEIRAITEKKAKVKKQIIEQLEIKYNHLIQIEHDTPVKESACFYCGVKR